MDNGEVIPGLNEDWTLGGAKLGEWIAGFMMFIVCSELIFHHNVGRAMPQLMMIWIATTFGMAAMRKGFPDEERGVRNAVMTSVGIEPPDIPAPAALQPYWSGAPLRMIDPKSDFAQLGLDEVLSEDEEGGSGVRA